MASNADAAIDGLRNQILDNVRAITNIDRLKVIVLRVDNDKYQAMVLAVDNGSPHGVGPRAASIVEGLKNLLEQSCEGTATLFKEVCERAERAKRARPLY